MPVSPTLILWSNGRMDPHNSSKSSENGNRPP
jgi:hypothetical protein